MLSVRLPDAVESELIRYCQEHQLTKSQVVQRALAQWLNQTKRQGTHASPADGPDLSFLAADDPVRRFVGAAKGGMSTDELMRQTRGEGWNMP